LVFFFFCYISLSNAKSQHYYEIIDAIEKGIDLYKLLEVSKTDDIDTIKKAWRVLAKKLHPDKNPGKDTTEEYRQVQNAYSILSDSESKREYDQLNSEGIPWHEKYYGKYAHAYGAPDHDIRWVLFWTVIAITVIKYLYGWYHYYRLRGLWFKHSLYRQQLREVLKQKGVEVMKTKKKKDITSQDDFDEQDWITEELARLAYGDDLGILGLRKPKLTSLFIFDLLKFPYNFPKKIYDSFRTLSPEEKDKIIRKRANFEDKTDEEWIAYKSRQQRLHNQTLNSTKMKQARRFWKKHESTPMQFE